MQPARRQRSACTDTDVALLRLDRIRVVAVRRVLHASWHSKSQWPHVHEQTIGVCSTARSDPRQDASTVRANDRGSHGDAVQQRGFEFDERRDKRARAQRQRALTAALRTHVSCGSTCARNFGGEAKPSWGGLRGGWSASPCSVGNSSALVAMRGGNLPTGGWRPPRLAAKAGNREGDVGAWTFVVRVHNLQRSSPRLRKCATRVPCAAPTWRTTWPVRHLGRLYRPLRLCRARGRCCGRPARPFRGCQAKRFSAVSPRRVDASAGARFAQSMHVLARVRGAPRGLPALAPLGPAAADERVRVRLTRTCDRRASSRRILDRRQPRG